MIIITDKKPDVRVTQEEYRKYFHEYQKAYMFYSGPPVSLEEYIRQQKAGAIKLNDFKFSKDFLCD
jgi:hypothetical protein